MALDSFIPEIWSARLLVSLKKFLVYGQAGVVNRDYEGEIAAVGDTVRINSIGPVSVGNYVKNTNIGDPETLTDAQSVLTVDQSKYFNFQVDDIDRVQQNPKVMDQAMQEAAYGLRDAADQFLAGLYTGVASGNTIGDDTTPVVPVPGTPGTGETNVYDLLVDMAVLLTDAKVPQDGRWVIVPPWFYGRLLKEDRFVDASKSGSTDTLRNGQVGQAAGFTVMQSHNVPNTAGAKYKIIAGHTMAISYAEQINKVEAYRPEKRFADAVKGLHIYGAKLIRPTAIVVTTANTAA